MAVFCGDVYFRGRLNGSSAFSEYLRGGDDVNVRLFNAAWKPGYMISVESNSPNSAEYSPTAEPSAVNTLTCDDTKLADGFFLRYNSAR